MTQAGLLRCDDVSLWSVGSRHSAMLFSWASDAPLLLVGPPLSFFLSQDDINEAADEAEREGHPGQHVGVAVLSPGPLVRTHHGVDDGRAHHKHAWGRDQRIRGMGGGEGGRGGYSLARIWKMAVKKKRPPLTSLNS